MKVKTAVSIEKDLFTKAETVAKKLGVSRSTLFAMGLQEIIEKRENRKLLEKLNHELG